ncbi:MAG: YHYH protein [Candidatus Kapaibacterium sp.]
MRILTAILLLVSATLLHAQEPGPEVTSWIQNTNGATGYHGLLTNVQKVQYSTGFVYISCTCIPGYDIGPWAGNPNQPANQNFIFKLTRTPARNTGTAVGTPLGHIGIWRNGVSMFNAKDARSYNNGGAWNQNAIVVEGSSFDSCLGHPAPNGEYHHHLNPRCLYDDRDSLHHSPIIGYAFDGYPMYGAYGFASTNGIGPITRMRSGYRLRDITKRTTSPTGATVAAGPDVSSQYLLGYYVEDFEFVNGLGDLDEHNGRFCVTPEYPGGTYAYFITLDATGIAVYPYTVGPTYYGVIPPGNTGPQSGHNTATEPVTTYSSGSAGVNGESTGDWNVFPNPATVELTVQAPEHGIRWRATLNDILGHELRVLGNISGGERLTVSVDGMSSGNYFVRLQSGRESRTTGVTIGGK